MKCFNAMLILSILLSGTPSFAVNGGLDFYIRQKLLSETTPRFKSARVLKGTYNQLIDHFDENLKTKQGRRKAATFPQRYFIVSDYAKSKASPVIYVICGEGTCDGADSMSAINRVAQKYQATLIALEHRYYGYSQPFETLESKNLKYLSTAQAIEDLARFQKHVQKTMEYTGKWIAVGGSYPGSLAAFYRLKHPELVVGALASSAPVLAKADFFEYDQHVAKVAGPICLDAIQKVVAEVEQRLSADPQQNLEVKKLFEAETVKNDTDFLYILADMAAAAIQYGYQEQFCGGIVKGVQEGRGVEVYAEVGIGLFSRFGITPVQSSFQGAESIDPKDYLGFAGMRAWMYQSCTEYGYYQIVNPVASQASRSSKINQDYHNDVCNRLFGLAEPVNTTKTNQEYYDLLFNSNVTNIYFTNGDNDPWSNLSLTPSNPGPSSNPGLTLFSIAGAAHCDDLGMRLSTQLTTARTTFMNLVGQWLQ